MKNVKKIIFVLLIIFSLCSCNNKNTHEGNFENFAVESETIIGGNDVEIVNVNNNSSLEVEGNLKNVNLLKDGNYIKQK